VCEIVSLFVNTEKNSDIYYEALMPLGIRIYYEIAKEREGPGVGEKEMSVETVDVLRMQYWPYE
jgi:hypothetical protein